MKAIGKYIVINPIEKVNSTTKGGLLLGEKDREDEKLAMEVKGLKNKMSSKSSKKKDSKSTSTAKGKVFTAKNGRKYIKMANGRTKFIKG